MNRDEKLFSGKEYEDRALRSFSQGREDAYNTMLSYLKYEKTASEMREMIKSLMEANNDVR